MTKRAIQILLGTSLLPLVSRLLVWFDCATADRDDAGRPADNRAAE